MINQHRYIAPVFTTIMCALTAGATGYTFPEEQYRAECYVEISGKVIIDHPCPVQVFYPDDDTSLLQYVNIGRLRPDGKWTSGPAWVWMDLYDGGAEAYWNGVDGDTRAKTALGTLEQQGECWVNEQARICVYAEQLVGAVEYLDDVEVEPAATASQTAFRGLALGMTREQVETALSANGMRCLTRDELFTISDHNMDNLAEKASHRCLIVKEELDINGLTGMQRGLLALTFIVGPYDTAVSFNADKATVLSFSPAYFNADGMYQQKFAQSISENYNVILDGTSGGWSGRTNYNELIRIILTMNGEVQKMEITNAGPAPSFN